jgi:hypothetical protein
LRLRFKPPERFLLADFFAALVAFLPDLRAGLIAVFAAVDDRLPPEKMLSQLSEYFFVAPIRTTLMAVDAPDEKRM